MMGLGLVQQKRHMLSRGLAQRCYVYPHVRQRCPEPSRSELHRRSIGSVVAAEPQQVRRSCGEVTELNTNRNGTRLRHRFSTDLGFVPPCRSFGGGSPIPQQLSKNREILKSERAGAADVATNVVQSQSQSIQRDCGGSRRVRR